MEPKPGCRISAIQPQYRKWHCFRVLRAPKGLTAACTRPYCVMLYGPAHELSMQKHAAHNGSTVQLDLSTGHESFNVHLYILETCISLLE